MKILIAINELDVKAGAQKVAIRMAEYLSKNHSVEFIAGRYDKEKTFPELKKYKVKNLKVKNKHFIVNQIMSLLKFSNFKGHYDLIICHDFPSTSLARKNSNIVWYCHTPPRYLYDLNKKYIEKLNLILKIPAMIYTFIMRIIDKKNIKKIKKIIANSQNVKNRIKQYYNQESTIIYPGTEIPTNIKIKFKKEILSIARLYPEKNVDKIVEAMIYLPDYKLNVVGKGPEKENILKIIKKNKLKNVNLLGAVEDKQLKTLLSECYCTVYIPNDEDFGLIPIESNAYGKMCIGANEGGLKETIIDGKTGYLINKPTPKEIFKNIQKIEKINPKNKINECKINAKKFSWNNFNKQISEKTKNINN